MKNDSARYVFCVKVSERISETCPHSDLTPDFAKVFMNSMFIACRCSSCKSAFGGSSSGDHDPERKDPCGLPKNDYNPKYRCQLGYHLKRVGCSGGTFQWVMKHGATLQTQDKYNSSDVEKWQKALEAQRYSLAFLLFAQCMILSWCLHGVSFVAWQVLYTPSKQYSRPLKEHIQHGLYYIAKIKTISHRCTSFKIHTFFPVGCVT